MQDAKLFTLLLLTGLIGLILLLDFKTTAPRPFDYDRAALQGPALGHTDPAAR